MIGVIADDLTGAAEIGAVGHCYGLTSEIVLQGNPSGKAMLVCIDTNSRSCSATVAARRTAKAARTLKNAGADWVYKKVDSILRGQVLPELKAVMSELGLPRALLAPANPGAGRVIRNGRYFINNKPIHQTHFAQDPEHPRLASRLKDMLGGRGSLPVHICRVGDNLPGQGVLVAEAACTEDLSHWSERWSGDTLACGAAAFFETFLRASSQRRRFNDPDSRMPGTFKREFFVCGSASLESLAFVEKMRSWGVPICTLPPSAVREGKVAVAGLKATAALIISDFRRSDRVMLTVGLPRLSRSGIGPRLVKALAYISKAVLGAVDNAAVYAEGGATAIGIAQAMGWRRFAVEKQLAPGVVVLRTPGMTHRLIVKPGSYRWPTQIGNGAVQCRTRRQRERCGGID